MHNLTLKNPPELAELAPLLGLFFNKSLLNTRFYGLLPSQLGKSGLRIGSCRFRPLERKGRYDQ
jgi:hypothetical protein